MKLSIKKLTTSDIGPMARMMTDLYASNISYPQYDDEEIERLMFSVLEGLTHPNIINLIAYDGKKPAGFFMGHLAKRASGKPAIVGVADELYVVEEKRGQMVGLKLLQEALKWALLGGAQGIEAVAQAGKTDERWKRLGFEPYAVQLYMPIDQATEMFVTRRGDG